MKELLLKINAVILNPLIVFAFSLALLYFFWGIFQFVRNTGTDDGREQGKRSIGWGLFGMLVMVGVYGIIRIIMGTFGITPEGFPFN